MHARATAIHIPEFSLDRL